MTVAGSPRQVRCGPVRDRARPATFDSVRAAPGGPRGRKQHRSDGSEIVTSNTGAATRRDALVPARRRTGASIAVLVVAGLMLPVAAVAETRSSDQIQQELDSARRDAQELGSQLDSIHGQIGATEEELAQLAVRLEDARARLVAAQGQVALAEDALAEAEAERDIAAQEHRDAEAALDDIQDELEFEEARLSEQVVGSFKYGSAGAQRGAMVIEVLRRSQDPNDFAVGMKQLRTVIDVQEATVARVFELREHHQELADDAARARARASQAANEAEQTLIVVEQLRDEAAELARGIESDEERQRSVLASLQGTASEKAALRDRALARENELREELAAARARETGGSDRSGFPGWAGGPNISGAVCPVQGARAGRDFINDWGYPRWPNRWHQGNDIFASRGTPVVAVADGVVVRWNPPSRQTALGGITVTYRTSDGSEWYNAHLDSIASGIEPGVSVSRGQEIGRVGNTGNATSTPPHLHLGRRYGGSWVNPWPTVSGWC